MNLFRLVYWVLFPQKAVDYANNLLINVTPAKVRSIGYLNEFFFRYLTWGKSHKFMLLLSEQIDKQQYCDNKLINALIDLRKIRLEAKKHFNEEESSQESTTKTGVSRGIAKGKILNIKDINQKIPTNTIGIFPNAGTKYTQLYKKCVGLVFLKGGITSHGAIIAREFGIPAIVYPEIKIKNNLVAEIDGDKGSLTVV